MASRHASLNADKALIWRITHRQNLPWILTHGLQQQASQLGVSLDIYCRPGWYF